MSFSRKIKRAFKKLAAIFPKCRFHKTNALFVVMYQAPAGKTALDYTVEETYTDIFYQSLIDLAEFFSWADIQTLELDKFFAQAAYPAAIEYGLD